MNDTAKQAHLERLQDERDDADVMVRFLRKALLRLDDIVVRDREPCGTEVEEIQPIVEKVVELRQAGTELLQAAILKLNKPEPGCLVHQSDNRFRSVDARLIAAVKKFAGLVGLSLGEETEAEALDRKARGHQKRIEVVPPTPQTR